jgi:SAM-dependent methyltransferase
VSCRHCRSTLQHIFLDLGSAPPSNAYVAAEDLEKPQRTYPLKLYVCTGCWLVQTEDYAGADELFNADYAYFSSVSSTWLAHSARYADMITRRLGLGPKSLIVEVAANDGYLLRSFVSAGIPCLGIEPTASTAAAARARNIPVVEDFFGLRLATALATAGTNADLMVANNVLAHVPDINDFVAGFAVLLKAHGVVTFEFPHLMMLMAATQFDTVYHEHFSYLSLTAVDRIFVANGLCVFDVEQHSTHGGSLRVFAQRSDTGRHPRSERVRRLLQQEAERGVMTVDYYTGFQAKADRIKADLLTFLRSAKRRGKTVAGYGAAAKGNTLLNFAGVKSDLLRFVCDAAPSKQGKYLPGSHIIVLPPAALGEHKPDILLILPWNLAGEVVQDCSHIREWGGRFAVAVPRVKILPRKHESEAVAVGGPETEVTSPTSAAWC